MPRALFIFIFLSFFLNAGAAQACCSGKAMKISNPPCHEESTMPRDKAHSCDKCIFCSFNSGYVGAGTSFAFQNKETEKPPFLSRISHAHTNGIFRPPDGNDLDLSYQSKS